MPFSSVEGSGVLHCAIGTNQYIVAYQLTRATQSGEKEKGYWFVKLIA